jgi:hypothetical protein
MPKRCYELSILERQAEGTAGRVREIVAYSLKVRRSVIISYEAISFGEFMLRAKQWRITSDHRDPPTGRTAFWATLTS